MSRELHYIGRADHEPIDDARHFHVCATCGQPVDRRDVGAAVRHAARGHQPWIVAPALTEVVMTSHQT
jgi:hypothetical protein